MKDVKDQGQVAIHDFGLATLRIVVGSFSAYHALQQIVDMEDFASLVDRLGVPWPTLSAWLVVLGQLGLGGLLIVGLFTRAAGALTAVMFLLIHYTYYLSRSDNDLTLVLSTGTLRGVESLCYAATGTFLVWVGAGRFSLDALAGPFMRGKRIRLRRITRFLWPNFHETSPRARRMPALGVAMFRFFTGGVVVLHSVVQLATDTAITRLAAKLAALGLPFPTALAWLVTLVMLGVGLLLVLGLFIRQAGAALAAVAIILFLATPDRGGTVLSSGGSRQVGFHGEEFLFLAATGLLWALADARRFSLSFRRRAPVNTAA